MYTAQFKCVHFSSAYTLSRQRAAAESYWSRQNPDTLCNLGLGLVRRRGARE